MTNTIVGKNLKALRKRKKLSQEEVAQALGMNRSTYSGYENDVALPNIENLIAFSAFHEISVDDLVKENLFSYSEEQWNQFENKWQKDAKGGNMRVLTAIVDENNEEVIELIPEKARAGYVSGYADAEFMQELPRFQLPFLSKDRKYRAFTIAGDSMPPLCSGDIVVGEFIQDWTKLKSGNVYIVITANDGIVFKRVYNHLEDSKSLLLVSTNPLYEPYHVKISDVLEVWKFAASISSEYPDVQLDNAGMNQHFRNLQKDIQQILQTVRNKGN